MGEKRITLKELELLLNEKGASSLTAMNPHTGSVSQEENRKRNHELEKVIGSRGYNFIRAQGKYDCQNEEVFLVLDPDRELKSELEILAAQFEQESILHTDQGRHELVFVQGERKGQRAFGEGFTVYPFPREWVAESETDTREAKEGRKLLKRESLLAVPTLDQGIVYVSFRISGV